MLSLKSLLSMEALGKFFTNVAIFSLAVAGTYYWHEGKVRDAENAIRVELAQQSKRQIDELSISALKSESELKDEIRKVEDEKQIQKAIDADRINSLVTSLRNRPERGTSESNPPGDSCNCESKVGATGLQLYKSDGEFLARYSGMAAELQTELKSCYRQYDEVKAVQDKFKENKQ